LGVQTIGPIVDWAPKLGYDEEEWSEKQIKKLN